jgi:DNA-directed RNA polymerase specialized sigma24 family protein
MCMVHGIRRREVPEWDDSHAAIALATAHHMAARRACRAGMQAADRDDLQQEILLAIVERARRFDPAHAGWATFVGLLARHVIADRCQASSRRDAQTQVQLAVEAIDALADARSVTQPAAIDMAEAVNLRIDLQRLIGDLPKAQRETLVILLQAEGDIAAAQRASGRSTSAFYRDVKELRFWLRASGLVALPRARGKNHEVDR